MSGRNPNVENIDRWKSLISIDYLTQFVKAWIAFNAWYKNCYPSLEIDRDIINEIKNKSNRVRDRLISLIEGDDIESSRAKTCIADLHNQLEQNYTRYQRNSERITFTSLVIEINQKTNSEFVYRGVTYRCTRDPNNQKNITSEILNRDNTQRFCYRQNNGYNLSEIELHLQAHRNLTDSMKSRLRVCYQEINPRKPEVLLADNERDAIGIGGIRFINDSEKIAKAVIEVLYLLRNALFHGEITPDAHTQRVYEPAYHVLKMLVEAT